MHAYGAEQQQPMDLWRPLSEVVFTPMELCLLMMDQHLKCLSLVSCISCAVNFEDHDDVKIPS